MTSERADARLVKLFIRMFKCDTARISRPCGRLFLIIGTARNTKDDKGHAWFKNGKRIDFPYTEEHVIASGKTETELIASAKGYKQLLKGK